MVLFLRHSWLTTGLTHSHLFIWVFCSICVFLLGGPHEVEHRISEKTCLICVIKNLCSASCVPLYWRLKKKWLRFNSFCDDTADLQLQDQWEYHAYFVNFSEWLLEDLKVLEDTKVEFARAKGCLANYQCWMYIHSHFWFSYHFIWQPCKYTSCYYDFLIICPNMMDVRFFYLFGLGFFWECVCSFDETTDHANVAM